MGGQTFKYVCHSNELSPIGIDGMNESGWLNKCLLVAFHLALFLREDKTRIRMN